MNESEIRTDLFTALISLGNTVPQMRIGQLIGALGEVCSDLHGRGLWEAEDIELLEAVWRFRQGIDTGTAQTQHAA